MLEWVLVFALNGHIQKTEAMIAEACILQMLGRPAAQTPYCHNPKTGGRMDRPKDCETVRGWPMWCKKEG